MDSSPVGEPYRYYNLPDAHALGDYRQTPSDRGRSPSDRGRSPSDQRAFNPSAYYLRVRQAPPKGGSWRTRK